MGRGEAFGEEDGVEGKAVQTLTRLFSAPREAVGPCRGEQCLRPPGKTLRRARSYEDGAVPRGAYGENTVLVRSPPFPAATGVKIPGSPLPWRTLARTHTLLRSASKSSI